MSDLVSYYDHDYRILIDSEEEDQLYVRDDGSKTFRTAHQVGTLLEKVDIPHGAQVLDFGCAKSSTLKQLCKQRSDIRPFVFDVSDMYVPFWEQFIPTGHWATHRPPQEWQASFHVITSFFALEHVAEPRKFVETVARLLKPDGIFYCIIPNVYANTADFVVADHVNHFSSVSLACLLNEAGFTVEHLDDRAHSSAWVVSARKSAPAANSRPSSDQIANLQGEVHAMAEYWQQFGERIQSFEQSHQDDLPAAIYGSGFYGTFIATCLTHPENVTCFLDQNPHRQKQRLLNKPIRPPSALPADVRSVYVGLNPRHAQGTIASLDEWRNRTHIYFYP